MTNSGHASLAKWGLCHMALTQNEIRGVLRPGGCFLLVCEESDPSNTKWTDLIEGMTIYSGEDLETRLERAGFPLVSMDRNNKGWIYLKAIVPEVK